MNAPTVTMGTADENRTTDPELEARLGPPAVPATTATATPVVPEPQGDSEPAVWERAAEHFSRWQDGDATGLDDLVRLLTPVMWHVVRAHDLDRATAEDVLQDVWMVLVRRGDTLRDPRAVSGWLITTARRESWRTLARQRRSRPDEPSVLERQTDAVPSAEHEVEDGEERGRLWAAVQQLDERCRRLLRTIAFMDRPDYAGLAADLAMPVGSIGPTRGRCLSKLRALLGGELDRD